MGKQRSHITKFIAQNKLRQEFVPLLGKYVDLLKVEPLHSTNNAWQNWVSAALSVVIVQQTVHKPESPQGSNNSLWSSRQFPFACSFEVPERQRQVWEITQGLSSVVQREAKERYYILIWTHRTWIKVLFLVFCLFDTGTSVDQISFKGVSCETSHFGICCSQIQRYSFYLLKSRGGHWASGKAKELMPTLFQCQLFVV